jgi:hypothetical protein
VNDGTEKQPEASSDAVHRDEERIGASVGLNAPRQTPGWLFLLFGVIWPAATLVIEAATSMCAFHLFDPLPSVWHALLVASVPVINLMVWLRLTGRTATSLRLLRLLNGFAMGVAFYYTLVFLPFLPIGLIMAAALVGLLPLAPVLALIAGARGGLYMRRASAGEPRPRIPAAAVGAAIFVAAMLLLNGHETITRLGLQMAAASHSPEKQALGMKLLRTAGDEKAVLRFCYVRHGMAADLLGVILTFAEPIRPDKAREIYYLMTGRPFNAAPPPKEAMRFRGIDWPFGFDAGQGRQEVSGRIGGLRLESSRMDGSVDPDAALAYIEWTFVFKNETAVQQEARTQIALPPGGFVSRVTLWVNGEEREAVFAARGKVVQAYKDIVQQKRDPALVTTSGADQALIQCFPVPGQGGTMKVRLGITCPLPLENRDGAVLSLPRFVERNFNIGLNTAHLVWIESKGKLVCQSRNLTEESPSERAHCLRGALTDDELTSGMGIVTAVRNPEAARLWSEDIPAAAEKVIVETFADEAAFQPQRVAIVIDGSAGVKEARNAAAEAIAKLPQGIELFAAIASDEIVPLTQGVVKTDANVLTEIARRIAGFDYRGGCDSLPALAQAWDAASGKPQSVVLWIHGPQPVLLAPPDLLIQRFQRRVDGPRILHIDAAAGPNRVLEAPELAGFIAPAPRLRGLKEDLERLFSEWEKGGKRLAAIRAKIDRPAAPGPEQERKTSDHLARLWAHDQVIRLSGSRNKGDMDEALRIASEYRLVTPLTAAAVLETDADYARAGLEPPAGKKVPTIPEPETWALIIVALAALAWVRRKTGSFRAAAGLSKQ